MKKIILLVLTALMITGCEKEQKVIHKYEILLSTKDTMYVESSSVAFTSKKTVIFYDIHGKDILTIYDPIYIREIK